MYQSKQRLFTCTWLMFNPPVSLPRSIPWTFNIGSHAKQKTTYRTDQYFQGQWRRFSQYALLMHRSNKGISCHRKLPNFCFRWAHRSMQPLWKYQTILQLMPQQALSKVSGHQKTTMGGQALGQSSSGKAFPCCVYCA